MVNKKVIVLLFIFCIVLLMGCVSAAKLVDKGSSKCYNGQFGHFIVKWNSYYGVIHNNNHKNYPAIKIEETYYSLKGKKVTNTRKTVNYVVWTGMKRDSGNYLEVHIKGVPEISGHYWLVYLTNTREKSLYNYYKNISKKNLVKDGFIFTEYNPCNGSWSFRYALKFI